MTSGTAVEAGKKEAWRKLKREDGETEWNRKDKKEDRGYDDTSYRVETR